MHWSRASIIAILLCVVTALATSGQDAPEGKLQERADRAKKAWLSASKNGIIIRGKYEVVSYRILRASKADPPPGARIESEDLAASVQTVVFESDARPKSSGSIEIRLTHDSYRAELQPSSTHPSHRIYDFGEHAVYTATAGGDAIRLSERRKEVLFSDAGPNAFAAGPANIELPTRFLQLILSTKASEWIPLVFSAPPGTEDAWTVTYEERGDTLKCRASFDAGNRRIVVQRDVTLEADRTRPSRVRTFVDGLQGRPEWGAKWRPTRSGELNLLGDESGVIESLTETCFIIRDGKSIPLLEVVFVIDSYEFLPEGTIDSVKADWLTVEMPSDYRMADQRAAFAANPFSPPAPNSGYSIWAYRGAALLISIAVVVGIVVWRHRHSRSA